METDLSIDRKVMEVNFFGPIAITKGIWMKSKLIHD